MILTLSPPTFSLPMETFLLLLGTGTGVLSGLLGIGGGLLIIPALLFLPPLVGLAPIPIKLATGFAVTQNMAGGGMSGITHYRQGNLDIPLVLTLAAGVLVGGYLGAYTSDFYPDPVLKALFVVFLLAALVLTLASGSGKAITPTPDTPPDTPNSGPAPVVFRKSFHALGLVIGYVSGLMGIGGAVFLVPTLHRLQRIPLKRAMGNVAGLVLLMAPAAFLGKWQAGQVLWPQALYLTAGAVAGAFAGAKLQPRVPAPVLKGLMVTIILVTLSRMAWELWGGG